MNWKRNSKGYYRMDRTIVTTSHKPDLESIEKAQAAARTLDALLVERERMSFDLLREKYKIENIMVVSREQPVLHTPIGEYFFHPSMSVPRIKALKQGRPDNMVNAMSLEPGDSILDCTLGLGADAIVASYISGHSGKLVGLESVKEIAYIVKGGLKEYQRDSNLLKQAMSRIEVISCYNEQYLEEQPDNSFDIVYFDPMFRFPRKKISSIEPIRGMVNNTPLNEKAIQEAVRVARKRVVIKENWFSKEFLRLGCHKVFGGKYSPVAYGIIDKQEAEL
jgi:16S rRNA (guanine1516-N2)-methyltransferase